MISELLCKQSISLVSGGKLIYYTQEDLDYSCFVQPLMLSALGAALGAGSGVAATFLLMDIIGKSTIIGIAATFSGVIGAATYANNVGQVSACFREPGYY